jgi:hypothetical protein
MNPNIEGQSYTQPLPSMPRIPGINPNREGQISNHPIQPGLSVPRVLGIKPLMEKEGQNSTRNQADPIPTDQFLGINPGQYPIKATQAGLSIPGILGIKEEEGEISIRDQAEPITTDHPAEFSPEQNEENLHVMDVDQDQSDEDLTEVKVEDRDTQIQQPNEPRNMHFVHVTANAIIYDGPYEEAPNTRRRPGRPRAVDIISGKYKVTCRCEYCNKPYTNRDKVRSLSKHYSKCVVLKQINEWCVFCGKFVGRNVGDDARLQKAHAHACEGVEAFVKWRGRMNGKEMVRATQVQEWLRSYGSNPREKLAKEFPAQFPAKLEI